MRVAIVGCGQLGSRHGQALAKHPGVTQIALVDPRVESLELTIARLRLAGFRGAIETLSRAEGLSGKFFLSIIATSSKERVVSLKATLESTNSDNILLEKLLAPGLSSLGDVAALVGGSGGTFWVNCPRPFYPHYQNMHKEIIFEKARHPVLYEVLGTNFGLASNSIHFLDHFYSLTARPIISTIFGRESELIPSKRVGYKELLGSFRSRTEFGDELWVTSSRGEPHSALKVTIRCGVNTWEFDYEHLLFHHRVRGETVSSGEFEIPLQSNLTNLSLGRLEEGQKPFWSDIETSLSLHSHIFEGINELKSARAKASFT